jgi:hypothetical protein
MLIHFVSDWSVSRGGFTATYRTTFGMWNSVIVW